MNPIPASEQQVCLFCVFLAKQKLTHATIKCYLAAVRHLHMAGDPHMGSMAKLEQVLKGIKSIQAKGGAQGRERLPITPELLVKLKRVWEQDAQNIDKVMLWGAALLCFFGFLRAGEITVPSDNAYDKGAHLSFADISVDSVANPSLLKIRIKASKTDPFRQGVDVFVGRTDTELCPVAALLSYMAVRGPGPGPLFRFRDGKPLTRERFVQQVRAALSQAGINYKGYSGHSFRIGAATTAAKRGVADATIKMLGRWKSSAYQLYIRTPRDQLAGVSRVMVAEH